MSRRIYHIQKALPELVELEALIEEGRDVMRISAPAHVSHAGEKLPIYSIEMGSRATIAPTLALIGGVHGVERIGTQIILAFLRSLLHRLEWDEQLQQQLQRLRLLFIPLVNPSGMWNNSRCTATGVDLMRNAPVEAEHRPPLLVGGQRISAALPWYRGKKGQAMEPENLALTSVIEQTLFTQPLCISLDCHSGFGYRDRIWFPYAKSLLPWQGLPEAYSLTHLFEHSYPNHGLYLFEPQAHSYTTSGDVWDYLYDGYQSQNPNGIFLPLTLEMGSWTWVKKNPQQLFRFHSLFNPILPHRHQRILRRHSTLFDFLMAALANQSAWVPDNQQHRQQLNARAQERWYPDIARENSLLTT
ncbi:DUF2817 domain-containing protein [Oceanobacter mangrovi]|uniref:DUF2817 domain-containing protein n=1 Tax=Oceanobacter mangrovi TaxID=2862510 RepID=UPI001C8EE893|nr:DUF2817 domain-containing protein [Oceanobacter mangrovi]